MQKDFKIGLIIGLFLVIAALIWLSTLSSVSITSRFQSIQNAQTNTIQDTINSSAASKPSAAASAPAQKHSSAPALPPQTAQTKPPVQNKPPETKPAPDLRFHVVLRGQTLSDIAKQYYGAASKWTKIRDANPSINPNKLQPGTRLLIPP
jgi:nucleoid-associated protein YgaU